jgi:Zn-dependent alcohol dehydrogenase
MIKLRDLLNETYIGNCVDFGNGRKAVCNYFSDASHMATVVNPDGNNFLKVSAMEFYQYIDRNTVPKKAIVGNHEFYRVEYDGNGETLTPETAGLWWIYNVQQDIHYFFSK